MPAPRRRGRGRRRRPPPGFGPGRRRRARRDLRRARRRPRSGVFPRARIVLRVGRGSSTPIRTPRPSSWDAACAVAGAGLEAVDMLARGEGDVAFVVARPPGHHALADRAMGFCLINNVAVAAATLANRGERVLIVDWDVHHGNGTEALFWDDDRVCYVSTHQDGLYPGTGGVTDVGGPAARGLTVNVPLPPGATGDVFARAFDEVVAPVAERFDPTWVLVSAGYDAHRADPLAELGLSSGDYAQPRVDRARLRARVRPARVLPRRRVRPRGDPLVGYRNPRWRARGPSVGGPTDRGRTRRRSGRPRPPRADRAVRGRSRGEDGRRRSRRLGGQPPGGRVGRAARGGDRQRAWSRCTRSGCSSTNRAIRPARTLPPSSSAGPARSSASRPPESSDAWSRANRSVRCGAPRETPAPTCSWSGPAVPASTPVAGWAAPASTSPKRAVWCSSSCHPPALKSPPDMTRPRLGRAVTGVGGIDADGRAEGSARPPYPRGRVDRDRDRDQRAVPRECTPLGTPLGAARSGRAATRPARGSLGAHRGTRGRRWSPR